VIWIEPAPGRGTSICFTLPADASPGTTREETL